METLTIFVGCVEDISPAATPNTLEVTLSDVDISHLIQEVGLHNVLSEIKDDDIKDYLKDKEETEYA